jgi:hypothetical protein
MSELISMREFGRRLGVSANAVSKAVKARRIHLVQGKLDADAAARDWAANTNAGQRMAAAARAGAAAGLPRADPGLTPGDAGATATLLGGMPEQVVNGSAAVYGHARALREGYVAQLAKLEWERESGKVVEADKVRTDAFNIARRAREMILALPARLAPVLAGESNSFEVQRILTDELRLVCDEISRAKPV